MPIHFLFILFQCRSWDQALISNPYFMLQAFHKALHTEYRGLFIPPLPQKSFIDHKINEDFLRLRRADLQVTS